MSSAPSTLRRHATVKPSGHGVVLRPFDQAARGGRSIFPSRVFEVDEVARALKTGLQSRKIGAQVAKGARRGWPIFTLTLEERASCPRNCLHWLDCYGNNMHAAERIVADEALLVALDSELATLQRAHPAGFLVRLHVLGDFPAESYVAFWRKALTTFPALHVFGFTAHAPASFMGRMIALVSADFGWARWAIRFSGAPHELRAARVVDAGVVDPDAIACPAQTGATDCCATCALCWQSERSIAFRKH